MLIFRKIIFIILFTLIIPKNLLSEDLPKYVVYYDEDYPTWWVSRQVSSEVRDDLLEHDFKAFDAKSLKKWMEEAIEKRVKKTVVVMSQDVIPDTLCPEISQEVLIRNYLNSGGRIIWMGDIPFYYQGKKGGNVVTWGSEAGDEILGFYPSIISLEKPNKVVLTLEAKNFGISQDWGGIRPVRVNDVDYVLAKNNDGASGWIKNYNIDDKKSGFIRIWDCGMNQILPSQLIDLLSLATYELTPSLNSLKGKIFLPPPSEYYSVYHFNKDKVEREIRLTAYNPTGEKMNYSLKIRWDKSVAWELNIGESTERSTKLELLIPLYHKNQILELWAESKGKNILLSKKSFDEKDFLYKIDVNSDVVPINYLRFLIPRNKIILTNKNILILNYSIVWLGDGKKEFRLFYGLNKEGIMPLWEKSFILEEGKVIKEILRTSLNLPPKRYKFYIGIRSKEGDINILEEEELIVERYKEEIKKFGAFYTDLTYDGYVYKYIGDNNFDKKTWDEVWKIDPGQDVVVSFRDGKKFLFWKGLSYIPVWVMGNIGLTYEWVEASGGWGERAKYVHDCVEPLQDKECRYSRVKIVSSNPARCIVHWRYAECDMDYKIIDDEWVDEYYYFYPDGFGVRKIFAWIKPKNWHEINEFIVLLPAGLNPFEAIEKRGITILTPKGEKTEIFYPMPKLEWRWGEPAIFRIHLKNKFTPLESPAQRAGFNAPPELLTGFTPILVTKSFLKYEALYDGIKENRRYICPSYWGHHWPIMRNHPTCSGPPSMWKVSPTHASLLSPKHEPISSKVIAKDKELVVWTMFIGLTDMSDEKLLRFANSWLYPAKLKVLSGGKSKDYDPTQRCYEVLVNEDAKFIKLYLTSGHKKGIINPSFFLENFKADKIEVLLNNRLLNENKYRFGVEETLDSLSGVLFINGTIQDNSEIIIRRIK